MGLHKGMTNNPAGRAKGSKNKVTIEMKERIQLMFDDNFHQLQSDIDSLEPKDRVKAIMDLLPYLLQKNNNTNIQPKETQEIKLIGVDQAFIDEHLRDE